MSKRHALTMVIEGDDPTNVWEDVSATLGDSNDLLEDGNSLAFLGDPFPIVEKDEYHSAQVAYAVLSGVQRLRDGLPVRVHDGEELRSALDQVQEIADDGVLMLCSDGTPRVSIQDYVKAANAKLERIQNIAEAGEPDEDWPAAKEVFDALDDPRRDEENQAALDAAASVERGAVQACSNLAEFLNSQEQWNGGDVCEVLASELNKAGFKVRG
jgi:hypothetical protein